tara:strand:+ start:413 stop:802 length:390 start_codon:yes stop_codon:yes gene_type:complete
MEHTDTWIHEQGKGARIAGEFLPPGFLGVPLASVDRGNALVISVEKESITIRLAFGGAFDAVRCVRRASKCARLGVEKWVKFERRDESVASSDGAELDVVGLCEVKICVSRDPEMGCEASGLMLDIYEW